MSRWETPLLLILGTLFLAMAGWLGLSAWESLQNPVHTTLAVPVTLEETVRLEGILIREEIPIETHLPCCTMFARSGQRCAAGAVLGVGAADAQALRAAQRLQESRQLLNLSGTASPQEAAVGIYAAALSRGDMAAAGAAGAILSETPEDLILLTADTELLEYRLSGRMRRLIAPESGLFFPWTDGYEHLSPQRLTDLTTEALDALLQEPPAPVSGVCGRIVTGQSWYFAARGETREVSRLTPGREITLVLGGGCPTVTAEVCSVGSPLDGHCAVVLRCTTALRESAGARFVTGTAVTHRHQGLQLPAEAVRRDEDGTYVFLASGRMSRRADIEILYETNGSVLVEGETLHPGSEILVGGNRLPDRRS